MSKRKSKNEFEENGETKKHKTGACDQCIVLDIEGTTTPISFVHDVLFPYVLANLKQFLNDNWDTDECADHVKALTELSIKDVANGMKGVEPVLQTGSKTAIIDSLIKNVKWQMSIDRKIGPLKELQGFIWRAAYQKGSVKGIVYSDVVESLKLWKQKGLKVYIYSSGSIAAQKLLFKYSDQGDLLDYFSGHFDTSIGLKTEAKSYLAIAKEIDQSPDQIIFLTDNIKGIFHS